jgi:phosphohistidine phosphatase SixA
VQKLQGASAAPSQVQGVPRSDVDRPLDGGRGEAREAACLDGQETIAPSSLLAGGSHRAQETLRAMNRDRDKKATGGRIVGVTGARTIERQQAAFSVRGGGQDEAVLG